MRTQKNVENKAIEPFEKHISVVTTSRIGQREKTSMITRLSTTMNNTTHRDGKERQHDSASPENHEKIQVDHFYSDISCDAFLFYFNL